MYGRYYKNQQALNVAIRGVCDVLRRSNCASALQYIPELTWVLFLRILDEKENIESANFGGDFKFSLDAPYRWSDWAAPIQYLNRLLESGSRVTQDTLYLGWKRQELLKEGAAGLLDFINFDLLPYLRSLKEIPDATPRQKVISQIFSNIDKTHIDTQNNLVDVINRIHNISLESIDDTHIFTLSQAYEGLLLKMGEKKNDGGQFFTPREIIRAVVKVINPVPGETIYDPCCGTGGFLVQAYEFMYSSLVEKSEVEKINQLKNNTFYGREKDNLIYPITLANLVLHGIDDPHIWHGNTLTRQHIYDGLFLESPKAYDVILTNPPFGGKEGKDAQTQFAHQSSATQILFLQHVIDNLKIGGRCGMVVDEGVLFRTNDAFFQTKRRLLQECAVWCIISLPIGVFANAGASIKTNLLFFTKGQQTNSIWYYDLSAVKITRKTPFTLDLFGEFFQLLPSRGVSARSWRIHAYEIEAAKYDLKAVNPNATFEDTFGTITEIVDQIEHEMVVIEQLLQATKSWIN